jgi:alkylation response protein AidB-like acyl-CoA dehydrogenase
MLRQAAHADGELVNGIEVTGKMRAKNVRHARRESAIREAEDAGFLGLGIESQLTGNDVVITAQVAEMGAACNCAFHEIKVESIGKGHDDSVGIANHPVY